ncbi:MAG: hypothetical protein JXA24_03575 [Proteobacteria bacterium]|nr:hypothetical protein [Pseudomonadota bacterium]
MKKTIAASAIFVLAALAACDGTMQGVPDPVDAPQSSKNNPVPLSGDTIACAGGDDCEIVELGCCDHCNGGFAVAVNKEFASEVAERNSQSCGDDELCTEMACAPIFPRCRDGECVYVDEVSFGWQSCENDRDCAVVELGCCDHCNGGRVVAANVAHVDDVKESMSDQCDEGYACTLMACAPQLAKCEQGLCAAHPDPDWGIH